MSKREPSRSNENSIIRTGRAGYTLDSRLGVVVGGIVVVGVVVVGVVVVGVVVVEVVVVEVVVVSGR